MEALSRSHPYNALSLVNCAFLPIPMSYQCEYVYVKDVVARLSVSGGNDRAMRRPPVNDIAVMSSLVLTGSLRYSSLRYDRYAPVGYDTRRSDYRMFSDLACSGLISRSSNVGLL
jgi:hypothetical protein